MKDNSLENKIKKTTREKPLKSVSGISVGKYQTLAQFHEDNPQLSEQDAALIWHIEKSKLLKPKRKNLEENSVPYESKSIKKPDYLISAENEGEDEPNRRFEAELNRRCAEDKTMTREEHALKMVTESRLEDTKD